MTGCRNMVYVAICSALLAGVSAGCDRDKPQNQPSHVTTLRPDGENPPPDADPTLPVSRPTTSLMQVADRECVFPAARLILQRIEPTVDLLLFSDDARAALSSDYSGNRYHMLFRLDITDTTQLANADYVMKAPTMERVDSPDGIFLDGDRKQLQPYDVSVQFSQMGREMRIEIQGTFLMFGGRDDAATPVLVPVHGVLVAPLEDPRKLRTPKGQ